MCCGRWKVQPTGAVVSLEEQGTVEAAGCLLASLKESNSVRSQPGSPTLGCPGPRTTRLTEDKLLWKEWGMETRKGAAEKEAAETRKKRAPWSLEHQPVVEPLTAHVLSPHHNLQEGQEFKTTCLVNEDEMKKLLQERGHMLENHIERLWAYLTIQELLAKRYDPCGCWQALSTPEYPAVSELQSCFAH